LDDPDANGNGNGLRTQHNQYFETYSTGILLAAVAASGTPDRLVSLPGSPVDGWTYRDVAQDMVDFLAFGQVEYPLPAVEVEGGWARTAVDNGIGGLGSTGDQSITGYAVLGLAEAEDFGCTIPDWVKIELNAWIERVQDDVNGDTNDGGSWYSHPGDPVGVNILKTGNLILEMAFVGDSPDTTRVIEATDYLARHWTDASGWDQPAGWDGTPAQYQAMFCAAQGLSSMGIVTFNGIDWFADFSDAIVAQQYNSSSPAHGSWQFSSGRGESIIITEWALITLQSATQQPPNAPPQPAIEVAVDIRPDSSDNHLNVKSKGVLPVAIVGTEEFDVSRIDPASVLLEGVAPIRWQFEDLVEPDGFTDLNLKFDTEELATAVGSVQDGDVLTLHLTGSLMEKSTSADIVGEDVVVVLRKGKK
jgi:hypothetical protein